MIKLNGQELLGVNYEQPCILMGEGGCYKTTILLHYAYMKAKHLENNEFGLVVCNQTKLDKEDRLLFGRGDYKIKLEQSCTNRIKMKYIDNYQDLCRFLCAFHLIENYPSFLFVDDINYYVGTDLKKLGYLLFLLRNVSSFFNYKCKQYTFSVILTYQMDSLEIGLPLRGRPTDNDNDVNYYKVKQVCLLFRNSTSNLFQLSLSEGTHITMHKIHQDYETLKMNKSTFRNKEFKEIIDHIYNL